jgi:RNA polymerase sigma-70 factor, ECF subfamily
VAGGVIYFSAVSVSPGIPGLAFNPVGNSIRLSREDCLMDTGTHGEVTDLLRQWQGGDAQALERLLPMVYGELRRLARLCLRHERHGHTMQTGTLVQEACLRLLGADGVRWNDRRHFFAIAGRLMRRVLVDEARRRGYRKRGAEFTRVTLDDALAVSAQADAELLALNEALGRLEETWPRKCRVVELRYFAGLTIEETAEALDVSADIVKREWRTAKLWLLRELGGAEVSGDEPTTQTAG